MHALLYIIAGCLFVQYNVIPGGAWRHFSDTTTKLRNGAMIRVLVAMLIIALWPAVVACRIISTLTQKGN